MYIQHYVNSLLQDLNNLKLININNTPTPTPLGPKLYKAIAAIIPFTVYHISPYFSLLLLYPHKTLWRM